ncbi:hypothetical protein [Bacillus sp. NH11B]|uniref:hypothetical protein n=1 Tax=Bacillus sp. NH11B TaxID=1866314 RepID=UPI0008FE157F|nr:hypothetical protein [Bacillus sp. NH11B]OJD58613.1 hypothetical protein BAU27_17255 [Bacillus sp. NH11B]
MDLSWLDKGFEWLGSLGVFSIGTGIIVFALKKTWEYILKIREEDHKSELKNREEEFKRILNNEMEDHKSELRNREAEFKRLLDDQLEEHKSELKKINDKYQIQFSKLHVDRAEAIRILYSKLVKLESSGLDLLGPIGIIKRTVDRTIAPEKMQELVSNAVTDTNDLSQCFRVNQIYFSKGICDSFIGIIGQMQSIVPHFYQYTSRDDTPTTEETISTQRDTDKVVAEHILVVIPRLKRSLEDEFRKLLGVTEEKQVLK